MSENSNTLAATRQTLQPILQLFQDTFTQIIQWDHKKRGISPTFLFFSPSLILIFFSLISRCHQSSIEFAFVTVGLLLLHGFLKLTHNPISNTLHYQFLYTFLLALFIVYFGPALPYNEATILMATLFPLYYHILTSSICMTLLISLPIFIFLYFSTFQEPFSSPASMVLLIVLPTIFWTKTRDSRPITPQTPQTDNQCTTASTTAVSEKLPSPQEENIIIPDHVEREKCKERQASEQATEESEKVILGISHDCRNLLNSLKAILTLMKDDSSSTDTSQSLYDDNLQSAIAITEHLTLLLTNLLDYIRKSEDSNGKEEMRLTSTLEKIWLMMSSNLKKKNLGGSITIKNGTPLNVFIDERKFMGILLNLVGNAIKFTDTGHIKINVHWKENSQCAKNPRAADLCDAKANLPIPGEVLKKPLFSPAQSENGEQIVANSGRNHHYESPEANAVFSRTTFFDMRDIDSISFSKKCFTVTREAGSLEDSSRPKQGWLVVTVRDTGCGIEENSLKKLCKKYMQVGEDPEKNKLGYGLGLWYTKYLLSKLKGNIDFRSTKNVGTWVKVEIPCKVSKPKREIRRMIRPEVYVPRQRSSSQGYKPCVFIRENDRLASLLIHEYLKKHSVKGVNFIETESIADIIRSDKLQSDNSVIILGEKSVDRQEILALRMLNNNHQDKKVPVILLKEAEGAFGPVKAWDNINIDFFVKKPMRQTQLEQIATNIEKGLNKELFSRPVVEKRKDDVANVLIVDDDSTSLMFLQKQLEKNGIACLVAKDGVEAVETYKKEWQHIKLVLMDSEMPRMNGLEATKEIRQIKKNDVELKIMGLTGNDTEDFRRRAKECGMDDVFVKPVPSDRLLQIVNSSLEFRH